MMTTTVRPYDLFGNTWIGGSYAARCSHCDLVCVYWDAVATMLETLEGADDIYIRKQYQIS